MSENPYDSFWLRSVLADDRERYQPRDTPRIYLPEDSWSGARFLRWKSFSGEMILKIWPKDGPSPESHLWRHRKLAKLNPFPTELALPVEDSHGRTLRILPDGRLAELFRWLEGEQVGLTPTDESVRQVAMTVARLHESLNRDDPARSGISEALSHRLARLTALESAGYQLRTLYPDESIGAAHCELAELAPRWATIVEMCRRLSPYAIRSIESVVSTELPIRIVLRDVRPNHFLTRAGHVSGLLDFGAMGYDTIALDLSRLLGEWFRSGPSTKELVLRTSETFRRLEPAEIAAVEPLILASSILGAIAWFDIHFRRRLTRGRERAFARALEHAEARLRHQREKLGG